MANITDKLTDTRNAARPNSAKVTSPRSAGGSTLVCDNLTGWPTASKVHFVTYKIDSTSKVVAGSQLDCYGIVSGNSITSFTVVDGTDVGHAVNDVVEMLPTAAWGQDLIDALLAQHSRVGAHVSLTNTGGMTTDTLNVTSSSTLPAGDIVFSELLSTIFSGQVTSASNAGTAGGTSSYINLGGIKLLWITTANQTSNNSAPSYTLTLPSSFFTTVTAVIAVAVNMTSDTRQYISVGSFTNTTVNLIFNSPNGAGTTAAGVLVVGT